ncbi:MAG: hypothetical protein IKU17_01895 [Clostridia bacterium]|nr:hypothetical protein [Clostridia bacterium]
MSENKAGLVSISFRGHTPQELAAEAARCGLGMIEWGGDVHAPAGDVAVAEAVKASTLAAGLQCPTYGSYYRLGAMQEDDAAKVAASAKALGSKIIRVWGGVKGSADLTDDEYRALVAAARTTCRELKNFTVALECHMNTVTDDYTQSLRFLNDVAEDNLAMYWQPHQFKTTEYNLQAAKALAPYVKNVHVFHWRERNRYPLAGEVELWKQYAAIIGTDVPYMLEFMPDDRLETLETEAKALLEILK